MKAPITSFHARRMQSQRGQPAWDVALLFPPQGEWSEEEFLALENNGENRMMELVDGVLEILPMPNVRHQRIAKLLLSRYDAVIPSIYPGEILPAPLPVWLWSRHFREPDLTYFKPGRIPGPDKPPRGADLAIEIVSPGKKNRQRDVEAKRRAYAKAKIAEYWIVDPQSRTITVLTLGVRGYKVHGVFGEGERASSKVLAGFSIDVGEVFAAGDGGRVK